MNIGDIMTYVILLKKGSKRGTYEFLKEISPVIARSNDESLWGGFYSLGFKSYENLNVFLSKADNIKLSPK